MRVLDVKMKRRSLCCQGLTDVSCGCPYEMEEEEGGENRGPD